LNNVCEEICAIKVFGMNSSCLESSKTIMDTQVVHVMQAAIAAAPTSAYPPTS